MKMFRFRTKKAVFRALSDGLRPSISTKWIDYTLALLQRNVKCIHPRPVGIEFYNKDVLDYWASPGLTDLWNVKKIRVFRIGKKFDGDCLLSMEGQND